MSQQDGAVLHHVDISFWEYAEKMDDGSMGCKFCGHPFAKGTSITRIKFHLAGVKGRGVRICGQVPRDVQEEALAAIDGPLEKKLKTGAGSSNNEVHNVMSASAQQQRNEMMMAHQREDQSLDWMASITVEDEDLHVIGFNERPSFNQVDEPRGDPSQPTNVQLCSPSVNNDVIMNDSQNLVGVTSEPVVQNLEQSNAERHNLSVDAARTQVGVQGIEQGGEEGRVCSHLDMENTGEGSLQHVDRIVPPTTDENYNRREATQRSVQHRVGASSFVVYGNRNAISTTPQEQNNEGNNVAGDAGTTPAAETMGHAPGRSVEEIVRSLEACLMGDGTDNGTGGGVQPGAGASSFGGLTGNTNEIKGDALPTRKLVGQAFEDNKKSIWSLLMGDEVSSIGIYGMGGVGKTALVTHLYNQLLERPQTRVYWITASQDTSINRLQSSLARRIGLDLSNEDDELHRVVALKKELMKQRHKWVLILDDLWKAFDLQKLGIPDQDEGCKLIITTRSEKICQQMKTQHAIKVQPISEEEAWALFIERLEHGIALSPEVKRIAVDVVRECAGLPLGIITMAGCMRGVYDPHEWRNTLKKLKGSKSRDMEDEVFRLLRFSYDRLDHDSGLQQCLLYCALFPEDHCIEREELIGYLIDEGIIEEMGSRQAAFDEGHTMLNKLEAVSLLERGETYGMRSVKMHDLIRDMAIQILQKNSQTMVKAGAQLRELPDEKEWTENFTRVSLMHNNIKEIPSNHSPRCPSLSTLLLCENPLVNIADSFFERLHGLKVLDLSFTDIRKLPDYVSRLVSLTALVLKKCKKLRHVPSLEKLTALKKLDLTSTALEKMPQGMECLRNLEYLAMNGYEPLVKMLRKNDPVLHHVDISFWEYAEKMDDDSMGCKFCGHPFAKGTSITRIKFHLAGVKGRGVRICGKVPQDVQDAALAASDGPPEKKLKTGAGSSNNEVTNVISASAQQQNNEMMMTHQREDLSFDEDCLASITAEDMELLVTGIFNERPSFNQADEPRGDPSQPTNDQLCSPSVNNDAIVNDAQNVVGVRTEPVVQVLEQSNAERDNLSVDAGRTQVGVQGMEQGGEEGRVCSHLDMENTGEGSAQHVDRIVPPTIDENYNRREATERSVQHGVGASSFEVYGNHDAISTSPQDQNNEVDNAAGDAGMVPAAETMGHAPGRSMQEYIRTLEACLMGGGTDNGTGGVVQPGAGASSFGGLTGNTNETPGDPLPTSSTKPVGLAFEQNTNEICSLLEGDKVSTIGIYGMGGVGKTTMLKNIYNKLLGRRDICHSVYWVTVSRDFSIERLQNLIAKCIKLDLSSEDDDLRRATRLSKELRNKQKWILILDDLWNTFELHEVGIPDPVKGFKLIMTTRSKRVCQGMRSQRKIEVKSLSVEEAWTLFMEKLGHDIALSLEVERIAKDIVGECAGLPLGVITMAGSLRGVDGVYEWRNTLKKLKESKSRDMEDEVFRLLRFSYDQLHDLAHQQCLVYCALFPEDHCIEREQLISYLIDEEIIEEMGSRQEAFDQGHTMLDRLEDVSLLERVETYTMSRGVKMHDLLRDMAIQILRENSQTMVKAGAQLRKLPDEKEWTETFTRVSLMHNNIKEIPSSHSPRCPSLSTLLLCRNPLVNIADSFFERLHGLKVLDLSSTNIIKLPGSVSGLVSLTALVLKYCMKLRHVPSLEKLTALKKLDLTSTALEKMPQGMECLRNLEYLVMYGCGEREFPSGLLLKLSHLQVLVLEEKVIDDIYALTTIKGKEVGCLKKLESLKCQFEGHSDFVEYLKSRDETQSLSTYCIWVGHPTRTRLSLVRTSKTITLTNLSGEDLSSEDFQVMFPKDIQQLIIDKCHDATSLCDVFSLINYATELEDIRITHCESMESLVSSSNNCSALNGTFSCLKMLRCDKCGSMKSLFPLVLLQNLVNLEMISVRYCQNMEEIIGEEWVAGEESSSNMEFKLSKLRELQLDCLPALKRISSAKVICDSLEKVDVERCNSMEILFPSSWSLVNLERIEVEDCEKMEEIIGGTNEIILPKLTLLDLRSVPELKRISSAKLICDSLEEVYIYKCNSMEILFPSSWSLLNLKRLYVQYCEKMEEIKGGTNEIILPMLRYARFYKLPKMKSICSAKLIFNNLKYDFGEWASQEESD